MHHGIEKHGLSAIHFADDYDYELLTLNYVSPFLESLWQTAHTFISQVWDDVSYDCGRLDSIDQPPRRAIPQTYF